MNFKILFILLVCFRAFSFSAQQHTRIISLAPSVTKNIYRLGSQKMLVGCTSYCPVNKSDNIQIVGNAVKVNLEKILSLKPDMVITTELTSPETIAILKKSGIQFKVFDSPVNFEGICTQFMETAVLLGKDSEAKLILSQERAKLESLKKLIPKQDKKRIFIELGAKPLFAVIPNTFMHDYINFVGGINITTDMSTGIISRESVLLKNPDVIFITTMGATGNEEIETWMKYKKLNAVKNRKIFTLDSDMACTPCPDSFTSTVEMMIKLIYGKQ
jgi:ABC-type Fe3+-hydroxamate transport system substrate-binding protein